ncbi:MAG: sugar transporter ATP-binding protein [Oscillospiraceae bacterium]|nr:sugar transporter ATP-binding protein [Oscillospiraceae bacterium]
MEENRPILSMEHITKTYPGVIALNNVSVSFARGEIHALVGENGAGKSTLIKIITGAVEPDNGIIRFDEKEFSKMHPNEARKMGIEAIYQEYNLIDCLSAAENICLGKKMGRFVNQQAMAAVAKEIFERFHINIDPRTPVSDLTSAKMQIVEIAKAVSKGARLLIMDEPTAPLTVSEIDILMDIIAQLKADGVTILYISHRMDEIFRIADRVSVFRDGQYVVTRQVCDTNRAQLIADMVGRTLSESYPKRKNAPGDVAIELRNLTGNGVKNISFSARKGEVVGLAGLVGAGRSEIMKVVYGAEKKQWGEIYINGTPAEIRCPRDAMKYGIGLVPEDRKREGCFLMESIQWNILISNVENISRASVVDIGKEKKIASEYRERLRIRTPSIQQKVLNLSGGNQQKVVIAKALAANTDIIIFDEPTRGIDVGAKHEIYELMNDLCAEGKCIIMVTSDMEELLGMSDRIVVLHEREMSGEISREEFSQERVLDLASGGD